MNNIAIADLNKRGKSGEILKLKEKKKLNFGKKNNTLPLTAFFSKKRKNCDGGTNTPSTDGVANVLNSKTALVTSPPPKQNIKTCDGIFVDYVNIYFQANLSVYIQYASIVNNYIYKVGCVG